MRGYDPSIIELRRQRKQIRHLLQLTGDGRKIGEWPGTWWRANLETRNVEWTPFWPTKPFGLIDDKARRYLVPHESSHIKYSGLYKTKTIAPQEKKRFHRFVNAIEDLRVDRLSAQEFGGFEEPKLYVRRHLRSGHGNRPEGWSLVDAVGLNAVYAFDLGLEPEGTELAKEASRRLWPMLDRIANLRSTQEVVDALEPIFRSLVTVEQEERERQEREERERQERERQEREERERQEAEESEESEESESTESGESGETGETGESDDEDESAAGDEVDAEPDPAGEADDDAGDEGEEDEEDAHGSGGDGGPDDDAEKEDGEEDEGGSASGGGLEEEDSAGDEEGADEVDQEEGELGVDEGEDTDAEDDPLSGLDELPEDVGADEPTDKPILSDGDPDTEPLPIGEDLEGMAEDATDEETREELERLSDAMKQEKRQTQEIVDKQIGKRMPATSKGIDEYNRLHREWRGRINVLAQRLKTVLQHNAMSNPLTGQRRGRFDPGRAYRLRTGSVKIFTQPGTVGGLDYTFGLLPDTSHSMWSQIPGSNPPKKEVTALMEATILIAEALEDAGLPFFLIFWDEDLTHVKTLEEPLQNHRGSIGAVCTRWQGGGDTIESPAISRAMDEFEKVPHGKRLLISITDGQTSTVKESKELLAELEAQGVSAVTIRIGGEPAKHWERGYRVEHADELTKLLPQLINEVVTRAA